MNNEENAEQAVDSAKNSAGNLLSSVLSLKEKNPKVFFGIVGGVIGLVILIMISSGGGSNTVSGPVIKNLVVGQKYILKSANAYDTSATVRLVSVPGAMAAYDDTEEADRSGACMHIPQGTPVSVLELQDAFGKKNSFVKVQIEEGECKGNNGWALGIDVQ
ncbi:MAG: hypothetical protein ACXW1W_01005 [Methylococcaceae bacterium]